MSDESKHNVQQQFPALFHLGRQQGHLTYGQMNDHLPEGIQPEQLDQLLLRLEEEGIEVVDDSTPSADPEGLTDPARRTPLDDDQWKHSSDPSAMLAFLRASDRASERKLLLFGAALCRRIWPLLTDERSRTTVEIMERFADGKIELSILQRVKNEAYRAYEEASAVPDDPGEPPDKILYGSSRLWRQVPYEDDPVARRYLAPHPGIARFHAAYAVVMLSVSVIERVLSDSQEAVWFGTAQGQRAAVTAEVQVQASLLRDLIGPHAYRPVPLDPAWRTDTVVRLATACDEKRELPTGHLDNRRLGVLADSIEEAGCGDAELLGHLRSAGPHVQGCWAVDLLRGTE